MMAEAEGDGLDGKLRNVGFLALESGDDDGMLDRIAAKVCGTPGRPREIGRFVVSKSLGRGGMGTVLEAWDAELERNVAIKVLRRDRGTHARRRKIIEAEARALARLADRHVVQVYETGEHDGALFVVMELVDGEPLSEWQVNRRDPSDVLDKYIQAGRGLAAAHRAGLVHRDFKPANVLLRKDGEVRVVDFGLALAVDREHASSADGADRTDSETSNGPAGGTRAYMAPEQLAFGTADARSDQFSFCVALHEALTGERPFDELQLHALALDPGAVTLESKSGVPGWVARILARGLAAEPTQRWPSMDALVHALVETPKRRRRRVYAIGGLLIVGIGGWSLLGLDRAQSCDVSRELDGTWGATEAGDIRASFATMPDFATTAGQHLIAHLDEYAMDWRETYEHACKATWHAGTRSPAQFEAEIACLEQGKVALGKAVELLSAGDAEILARAPDVVAALRDPGTCRDDVSSGPPSEREAELLRNADAVTLELAAGRPKHALALSDAANLGPTDRHAAAASAWLARGAASRELARRRDAERALLEALGLATVHDANATGVRALWMLLELYAYEMADPARTAVIEGLLEAFIDGVELSSAQRAAIVGARARAASLRGDVEGAKELFRQAIEAADSMPRRTDAALHLGALLQGEGRFDEARSLYREVTDARVEALGEEHPEVGTAEHALGALAAAQGRTDEARSHFERALEIWTSALGPESVRRASALAALADLATGRGEHDAALELAEEAWRLQQTLPVGHPDRGTALQVLAAAHLEAGQYARSLAEHEALLLEHPAQDRFMADGLRYNRGWLLCQLARCPEAREPFETASRDRDDDDIISRYAKAGLAAVELAEGRPLVALARARRLETVADSDPAGAELIAELRCTIALALAATEQATEALEPARAALTELERVGRPHACIEPLRELLGLP